MPGPIAPLPTLPSAPQNSNMSKMPASGKPSFYDQARQKVLVKKQLQKQAAVSNNTSKDPYKIKVGGTGSGFRDTGMPGFQKRLRKLIYSGRMGALNNISKEEGQILHDVIEKRMRSKPLTSDINKRDRKIMNKEITKNYKEGKISFIDRKDMKKVIQKLEK